MGKPSSVACTNDLQVKRGLHPGEVGRRSWECAERTHVSVATRPLARPSRALGRRAPRKILLRYSMPVAAPAHASMRDAGTRGLPAPDEKAKSREPFGVSERSAARLAH